MPNPLKTIQRLILPAATCGALSFTLACASGLPAVLSATQDKVAVEFKSEGNVSDTRELAEEQCGKFGLISEFDEVDPTATSTSRVARYRCVKTQEQIAAEAEAEVEAVAAAAAATAEREAAAAAAVAVARDEAEAARSAAALAEAERVADLAETPSVSAGPAAEAATDAGH